MRAVRKIEAQRERDEKRVTREGARLPAPQKVSVAARANGPPAAGEGGKVSGVSHPRRDLPVGPAVRIGEQLDRPTRGSGQRLPPGGEGPVDLLARQVDEQRVMKRMEADLHAGFGEAQDVARPEARGFALGDLDVAKPLGGGCGLVGGGELGRAVGRQLQQAAHAAQAVVLDGSLEVFPPIGPQSMERPPGKEEGGRHPQRSQERERDPTVPPVIVVERDGEANGRLIRLALKQIAQRDDLAQAPEGHDLSAKHRLRQGRDDLFRSVIRLAHAVVDEDEVAPSRPSGLNGQATHWRRLQNPNPQRLSGSSQRGHPTHPVAMTRQMRIAQVVPHRLHPYSGILQAIVELTCALARHGAGVEIWQLDAWPEGVEDLSETLDAAKIKRVTVPMSKSYWRLSEAARTCIAEQSVDIVHFHGAYSPMNNLVARALKVPYALSPHGGYGRAVMGRHPLRKMLFKQLFERPMIRRAAVLWALTEAERQDIARFCPHRCVERGPAACEPAYQDADPLAFRRDLGVGAEALLAVFVGRLDLHYKRLDDVVRGFCGAPDWHLALIGPDWHHGVRRLQSLIRRWDLKDRVHLVGPRRGRALHEAFAAANLFVLMSRSEGLPMALLAALGHGVPALVSPEVDRAVGIAAAGAGWVCPPDGLAERLRNLSRQDGRKWEQATAAAVEHSKRSDWDGDLNFYLEVMRRKAVRGGVGLHQDGGIPRP